MTSKGLIFVSCLAAGALVSSPAVAKPTKKIEVKPNDSANDTGDTQ